MKRYDCYYTNDFGDDYPAFSREQEDGEWVAHEEANAQIATLNAKLARIRKIVFALDSAEKHSPSKVRCLLDEILREVGYE